MTMLFKRSHRSKQTKQAKQTKQTDLFATPNLSKFKLEEDVFVEKPPFRLDMLEERKDISVFERKRAALKKRISQLKGNPGNRGLELDIPSRTELN